MTDWHCTRCRRYAQIYDDARIVRCSQCNGKMRRGRGKGTTSDAYHQERTAARAAGQPVRGGTRKQRGHR